MGLLDGIYSARRAAYVDAGCILSPCGCYRYQLWREWPDGRGTVVFVMLNPSTGNAEEDDNTIRRCVAFARAWGFKALEIVNLCAWRATDPDELRQVLHPVSEPEHPRKNFGYIHSACLNADMVVCAWGGDAAEFGVSAEMLSSLRAHWPTKLHVLGFNKDGTPKHPLYVLGTTRPVPAIQ